MQLECQRRGLDTSGRPEQRAGYAVARQKRPSDSEAQRQPKDREPAMSNITGISREWRASGTEYATVGFDYEAPNSSARWTVETGRGDEYVPSTEGPLTMRHFPASGDALAWQMEWKRQPRVEL
jgi:hypothetical protein